MSSGSIEHPVFQAFLTPHRSLSRRGATAVISAVLVFTGVFALRFWLLGAWPVMLFCFIDAPLVVVLLLLNFWHARQSECLLLTLRELTIIQTDPKGRRRQLSVPTAWLRVSLQDERGASRIMLHNRGKGYEVGAFLHEQDRVALYEALRDALHDVKNPRFDNPQLREF
ncbi:MAG TPA: DUF2244 domain-containing protein [Rhodopila sp.]|nr:DUF2244 domain-containing protein [Rhodopila sp.]